MPTSSISALIIAKDEERDLPGCLESLKGAVSEVVVLVDASTSDRTEDLARAAGAKVSRRPFDDYASQRQAALELCAGDWVLWIDADERLTPELREELAGPLEADGYEIPFEVVFLGRTLRHLRGERHLRLFKRAKTRFIGGQLHEGVELRGSRGRLKGRMLHEPYKSLDEYWAKLDRYTTLGARKKYAEGRRWRPWHLLAPAWELVRRLLIQGAVLDGRQGVTWAGLSAYYTWLKYAKLRELEGSR